MSNILVPHITSIAYANAVLSIISTITIGLMFALGGFWGSLNDANSIFWMLTFVPLLAFFYRQHASIAPQVAKSALVLGTAAAVAFGVLQALLVVRMVTFEQTFLTVITLSAIVGAALLTFGLLARGTGTFPAGLTWLTIIYGVAFMVGGLGFWLGGWENPLGIAGFLLTALLGPVWGIWLGTLTSQLPSLS